MKSIRRLPTAIKIAPRTAGVAAGIATAVAAVLLYHLDGVLTKNDFLVFVAAVITSLSFGFTFALAVLAVNAFANYREIEEFKIESGRMQAEFHARARNIDRMLQMLPSVIETISSRLSQIGPAETESEDSYFRLLHGRLFMKLLLARDPVERLDISRDIVGSMSPEGSAEILDETLATLIKLRDELPDQRDLIDPLIGEGRRVEVRRKTATQAVRQSHPRQADGSSGA